MFRRIGYTWEAMGASWQVLKDDKRLLIFPVLAGIACVLVMASFAVPMYYADAWQPPPQNAPPAEHVVYYGLLFLFYFSNYFVITFFNAIVVGAAVMRLSGHEASLGEATQAAINRLPQIFGWALVAATVGFVLRLIEERSERVGAVITGLLGMAWSITTFLVVPILVVEGKGPIQAFKKSASLLRKTWGQQIIGNFGFGVIFFLLSLPALACIAAAFALGGATVGFVVTAVAVIYLVLLGLVQSTLQTIFQAVLYVYAAHNFTPPAFSNDILQSAMVER